LGGQHETDANVAGASSFSGPFVFGLTATYTNNALFSKQASGSFFSTGSLLYSYDLEDQNRDMLDVTAVGALNLYFNADANHLDLSLFELTAGPRFNFPNGGIISRSPASFHPYAIFDEVGLGWDQHFDAVGFGLECDQPIWSNLALKGVFAFDYLDQSTAFAYYSNTSYAVAGSYQIHYPAPSRGKAPSVSGACGAITRRRTRSATPTAPPFSRAEHPDAALALRLY
jgi:hypothetical protein